MFYQYIRSFFQPVSLNESLDQSLDQSLHESLYESLDESLYESEHDMNVIECEKCNIWVPKERFPFIHRKKKKIRGKLCKPCIVHQRKCRLSQSYFV